MDPTHSAGEAKTVIEQVSAGVVFAGVALAGIGTAIYSFFHGLRSKEKPERRVIEAAEITDTTTLARRLTDNITEMLRGDLQALFRAGAERDAKMDHLAELVQRIINEQEIARRARDEVARQLAERDRDRPR